MSAYCGVLDVRAALSSGAVSSGTQTAADLPDWQIQDSIDEAQAFVDAFLNGRYIIPISELTIPNPYFDPDVDPPMDPDVTFEIAAAPLRAWTRDVAAYLATLVFRKGKDLGVDDPIRLRYAMVNTLLLSVRDGYTILPFDTNDIDQNGRVEIFNLYDGTLFGLEDFNLTQDGSSTQRAWRAETAVP